MLRAPLASCATTEGMITNHVSVKAAGWVLPFSGVYVNAQSVPGNHGELKRLNLQNNSDLVEFLNQVVARMDQIKDLEQDEKDSV